MGKKQRESYNSQDLNRCPSAEPKQLLSSMLKTINWKYACDIAMVLSLGYLMVGMDHLVSTITMSLIIIALIAAIVIVVWLFLNQ